MATVSGERRTASGSVIVTERKQHWLFDRPKSPHDWRWVVGGIGKVLIVVGLLMFAFVAYQLWGTGIYTAQAQNELDDQFEQAAIPATLPPTTEATTTTVAPATTSSTPPVPTGGGSAAPATTTSTPAPTTTAGPATVPFPFAEPEAGDVVARLQIESIGVDYKIVQGVGLNQLAKGPGHFPESVLPGQIGNTAIAGHRTTHGAPLLHIDRLEPGDTIVITYPKIGGEQGPQFTYVVTGTEVVLPSDYAAVVPTRDPQAATLALVSCHPAYTATQRMVVHAELDPARSSTLFDTTERPTVDGPQVLPGDEPTSAAPGTDAATTSTPDVSTVPPTTEAAAVTPATPVTTAPTTVAPSPTPPPSSADAFAGGWFDDAAAWPQIILWGLLLAAICAGGYLLAKRTRRIWLGTLVSFVPFVIVLYFWFENVNRLLPPGL